MFAENPPTCRFLSNKRGYEATFGRDLLEVVLQILQQLGDLGLGQVGELRPNLAGVPGNVLVRPPEALGRATTAGALAVHVLESLRTHARSPLSAPSSRSMAPANTRHVAVDSFNWARPLALTP